MRIAGTALPVSLPGTERAMGRSTSTSTVGAQDLVPPRPVRVQLVDQLRQHLDVQEEPPHVLVEYGEIDSGESVDRPIAGGQHVPGRRGLEAVRDGRVGRRLQQQMDGLASPRGRPDGQMPVVRVNAPEWDAVGVVEEPLRLETGPVTREAGVDATSTRRPVHSPAPGPRSGTNSSTRAFPRVLRW
jgi:hypothetical protein